MRIDKYLANLGIGSRKEINKLIKEGGVFINNEICKKSEEKIKFNDEISVNGEKIIYKEFIYIALNKPQNYVSSNKDEAHYKSYKELLKDCPYANLVEIVGRLDVDTTGLLLLTNNGDLIHKLIHPNKDIFKTYYVEAKNSLSELDLKSLENGVKIDDFITKKAYIKRLGENKIELSISEGKFHQIKKMLIAVNNEVTKLHRKSIGKIELLDLAEGKWRYLSDNEIKIVIS
ncbi:MAG: pseudouridine synthase [Candidatus Gracilibacteria bacterium]|nr:pseudouridine synthase [Candidatus Gracilibacteria bacterium]